MKNKILSAALAAAVAFAQALPGAYAAELVYDRAQKRIVILGTTDSNAEVSLQMTQPGVELGDLTSAAAANKAVKFNNQTTAAADGTYKFDFVFDGETGVYKAYVADSNGYVETVNIPYVNMADYSQFLADLNTLAAALDYDGFEALASEKMIYFGDSTKEYVKNISFSAAMRAFCDYAAKNPLSADSSNYSPSTLFDTFVVMQANKEQKLGAFATYKNVAAKPEGLNEWFDFIAKTDARGQCFGDLLKSFGGDTFDEFLNNMTEAAILSVVRYAGGYENAKNVINQFKDFLGIDEITAIQAKKVAGNQYATKAELVSALSESGGSGGGSGSGSSGGSGGSGGGGGSSSKPGATGGVTGFVSQVSQEDKTENKKLDLLFSDLDVVPWAVEAITALFDKNIVSGKSEDRFYPEDNVTREEFVKLVVLAKGLEPVFEKSNFVDVGEDEWYCGYINAAYKNGLINGKSEEVFGVGESITRQDMAVIIYNMLKPENSSEALDFADAGSVADYAKTAVGTLSALKIINGTGDGNFVPQSFATRAEAAKMIYGAMAFLKD